MSYQIFQLLSLIHPGDLCAVYAKDVDRHDGDFYLEKHPLDFIGVVQCMHVIDGQLVGRNKRNEIVGVLLEEGQFYIVNEDEYFAGFCRSTDDLYQPRHGDTPYMPYLEFDRKRRCVRPPQQ